MCRLWDRIVKNSEIPEWQSESNGCWVWTSTVSARYPRFNIWIPGRGAVQLRAHRVALVLAEIGHETEHFYDLYCAYSASGLEADHLCDVALCVNPAHLVWDTKFNNIYRRNHRADPPVT